MEELERFRFLKKREGGVMSFSNINGCSGYFPTPVFESLLLRHLQHAIKIVKGG